MRFPQDVIYSRMFECSPYNSEPAVIWVAWKHQNVMPSQRRKRDFEKWTTDKRNIVQPEYKTLRNLVIMVGGKDGDEWRRGGDLGKR